MDDGRRFQFLEQAEHSGAVPDVELMMRKAFEGPEQALLVPTGVASGTKKIRAHVVIHPMNFPTELAEVINHFRADQS